MQLLRADVAFAELNSGFPEDVDFFGPLGPFGDLREFLAARLWQNSRLLKSHPMEILVQKSKREGSPHV